jgi:predicted enzyme related to lactoylglutathione lyase
MANPTKWFEVAGQDRQTLKDFYAGLFGWQMTDSEEMPYSMIAPGKGGIPGGIGAAPEGHPGHVTFYVQVEDVEAGLAKAESLGGRPALGPLRLPGGGTIALFADPEGHQVGLMSPMDGGNGDVSGNPTVHFEVLGSDQAALLSFYTDLFGWKTTDIPSASGEAYALVEAADGGIAGGIGQARDGIEGHVTFYVGVDDLEVALDKAESLGGEKLTEPMDIPNGQIAHFADPEGHVIGLATGEEVPSA